MRSKLNLVLNPDDMGAQAPRWSHAPAHQDAQAFKPFLVPLGDDALAQVKPWSAPVRLAFLAVAVSLTWAIPLGAWLLL